MNTPRASFRSILIVLLALLFACTSTANPAQEPTPDIDATVEALVQERLSETSATSELPGPTATLGQLVDRTRGAVVRIETPEGVGSGTIFDPTLTPIPQPTATPRPTLTPGPTSTPQPTPGPTSTRQPTPGPTSTPRPSPGPTSTPRPSSTPGPTPRPTPSPSCVSVSQSKATRPAGFARPWEVYFRVANICGVSISTGITVLLFDEGDRILASTEWYSYGALSLQPRQWEVFNVVVEYRGSDVSRYDIETPWFVR